MINTHADFKKSPYEVSQRELDYFQKNLPIHYTVLMEMVRTGEARITDTAGG